MMRCAGVRKNPGVSNAATFDAVGTVGALAEDVRRHLDQATAAGQAHA